MSAYLCKQTSAERSTLRDYLMQAANREAPVCCDRNSRRHPSMPVTGSRHGQLSLCRGKQATRGLKTALLPPKEPRM